MLLRDAHQRAAQADRGGRMRPCWIPPRRSSALPSVRGDHPQGSKKWDEAVFTGILKGFRKHCHGLWALRLRLEVYPLHNGP